MNKRDYIKKAYQGNELALPYCDENGWIKVRDLSHLAIGINFRYHDLDFHGKAWRPRSLRGLEHNNGWTKVISCADIPSTPGVYRFLCEDGSEKKVKLSDDVDLSFMHWKLGFTHWKEAHEDLKPLY